MARKYTVKQRKAALAVIRRRRRMRGGSLRSFLSGANKFLRKTKLLSTVGSALGSAGVPYIGMAAKGARMAGYGKKKRMVRRRRRGRPCKRGGALRTSGGSLGGALGYGKKKYPLGIAY